MTPPSVKPPSWWLWVDLSVGTVYAFWAFAFATTVNHPYVFAALIVIGVGAVAAMMTVVAKRQALYRPRRFARRAKV